MIWKDLKIEKGAFWGLGKDIGSDKKKNAGIEEHCESAESLSPIPVKEERVLGKTSSL